MKPHVLNPAEIATFIAALDEQPEHTVSIHQLRNNMAKVAIIGAPDNFKSAVVQWNGLPEEPIAFGEDVAAIWEILQILEDWECVEVSPTVAPKLAPLMQAKFQCAIRPYDDIFYLLNTPLKTFPEYDKSIEIRLLNINDLQMLKTGDPTLRPIVLDTLEATLRDGVVSGAIVDNQLVAFSESRDAAKHAELGVMTHEHYRRRGLASALAGLLIQYYQARGLKIVWSTGGDNLASQRVAAKLGFREVVRRKYLIPQNEA